MSPPRNGDGRSPRLETARPTTYQLNASRATGRLDSTTYKSSGATVVAGRVFARDQRRRWPLVLVERCPACGRSHSHRATGLRTGACGADYFVVVAA
jgi:hypothetical protein